MNAKSLQNLVPAKKGEVRNKAGRAGKNHDCGVSLKLGFKRFLNKLSPDERDAMWMALYGKAVTGDVKVIELMVKLNDEIFGDSEVREDTGTRIILQIPELDTKDKGKDE